MRSATRFPEDPYKYGAIAWTLFGDPSLLFRTKQPEQMAVEHDGAIYPSQDEYEVAVPDAVGARCTLYGGGTIYGSEIVGETGSAVIALNPVPSWPTTLTLTVTASNRVTFQDEVYPGCVVLADGSGMYETIQDAVDAGIDGLVIELGDGEYTGEGNREIECWDQGLTIRSQTGDPSACVIVCGANEDFPYWWLSYQADELKRLRVCGLTVMTASSVNSGSAIQANGILEVEDCTFIDNGTGLFGGAVHCEGSAALRGCWFEGNHADYGGAVLVVGSADVQNCTFVRNDADYAGGGILVEGALEMRSCTLCDNASPAGAGVYLSSPVNPPFAAVVSNTIIADSLDHGSPVGSTGPGSLAVTNSDIFVWDDENCGCWGGLLNGQLGQGGNICQDPLFCTAENSPERPFSLDVESPCLWGNNHQGTMGAWGRGCPPVSGVPDEFVETVPGVLLYPPVPNPATGEAAIRYEVRPECTAAGVHLEIIDPAGRVVWRREQVVGGGGLRTLRWDGTDQHGRQLSAGVYFCRIVVCGNQVTRRFALIR